MMSENFLASVQYGDLKGTSAADRADNMDAYHWLTENDLIEPDEFILGITMFSGENDGIHKDPVYVNFLLTTPRNYDTVKTDIERSQNPISVRSVRVDMELNEFFGLFKRFNITLSPNGMLENQEYMISD